MNELPRKHLVLAGLFVATMPVLSAQQIPFGLTADPQATTTLSNAAVKSGGAEAAAFKGQFTFLLRGEAVHETSPSREAIAAGTITADGKGNITSGEEDFVEAGKIDTQLPESGTYVLNADGTGKLVLKSSNFTQTFSLFVTEENHEVRSATLIQIDGDIGLVGTLTKQNLSTPPDGSFHFSLSGETFETTNVPNAVAVAGTVTITQGLLQGDLGVFVGDAGVGGPGPFGGPADGGAGSALVIPAVAFPATLTAPDRNGRFNFTFRLSQDNSTPPINFIAYQVNAKQFNVILGELPSQLLPIISGSAVQ
jgi:hypothetical protein